MLHRQARRHGRFLAALALGGVVAAVLPAPLAGRVLAGADAAFAVYLVLVVWHLRGLTPVGLARHASRDDEGGGVILMLVIATIAASLSGIMALLRGALDGMAGGAVLAVAAVPLGWTMLHVVMAFRYADLFHAAPRGGAVPLRFPGEPDPPAPWDFLYFSFTMGMTAQTSDVEIATTPLRRLVVLHGALSFFYNAVIVALVVNVAVTLGR